MPDDTGGHDADERELRVLLERGVPQLPAPAQRLEHVRERVRRRARRRAVSGAGLAVAVVAAAGLLAPRVLGPAGPPAAASGPPASHTASAPTRAPASAASTAPPATYDAQTRRFADLAGLTLDVPRGWYVLAPAGSNTAWLATQPLALPPDRCAKPLDGFCTPLVRALRPGAVLVQVQVRVDRNYLLKDPPAGGVAPQAVLTACRTVGGTDQLGTTLVHTPRSAVVWAAACLARPGAGQDELTRALLTTLTFT